jgi:Rod binding domain-containing protein
MHIPSHPPHIQASQLPLESLAGNPNISDKDKVAEVSRQFEAVLLRQILQQARKPGMGASTDSLSSDVYSDMINQQLAQSISRSGAFGLAKSLQGQLAHQVLPKGGTHSTLDAPGTPVHDRSQTHPRVQAPETLSHDRKH